MEITIKVNENSKVEITEGSVKFTSGEIFIEGRKYISLPTDDGQERKTLSETKLPDLDASKIACGKINY